MKCATAALVAAALAIPTLALGQQALNFDAVQIKTTDLGSRTWMLEGQGGNLTVVAGNDAVLMVDTEYAPLYGKIKAAIGQVSDKPVKYVVDTHLHGDHTGGNQPWGLSGATVVAHANLKRSMAEGTTNALTGAKTAPAMQGALPARTYAGAATTLTIAGRRPVRLMHMPNAHTQGDTAVFVPDANVLATGDIVSWGGRYPNIDVGDKGDIDGIVRAVDAFIRLANDRTKVVPGHGPLMTRTDLVAYRKLLTDARSAVAALKAEGKSEDEAVAAKPLVANGVQERAGANDQASVNFVRLIYRSVG